MTERIFTLSVRGQWTGGGLRTHVVSTPDQTAPFNGRLIVMVHGYNNSQQAALKSYNTFQKNLSAAFRKGVRGGTGLPDIAHFYWPGDTSGIFDAIATAGGYSRALEHAQQAASMLAHYLANTRHKPTSVTFLGHSMGCRLILDALRHNEETSPPLHSVTLQAAAVGEKMFAPDQDLHHVGKAYAHRSHVFYSSSDWVLRFAYPPGQWLAYQTNVEKAYFGNAIGRFGPPRGFNAHKKEMKTFGHGDYWGAAEMAEEFSTILHKARKRYITARARTLEQRRLPCRTI